MIRTETGGRILRYLEWFIKTEFTTQEGLVNALGGIVILVFVLAHMILDTVISIRLGQDVMIPVSQGVFYFFLYFGGCLLAIHLFGSRHTPPKPST